jgi:hypothetical protein
MIGNRGYAMYIREWVRDKQKSEPYGDLPHFGPHGWGYLGNGCYRAAYLSPDKVVYKVQLTPGLQTGQANVKEYKKWWALRLSHRMPEGSRLPIMQCFEFDGHDDINAMEYVGKTLNRYSGEDYYKYSDVLLAVSRRLGLWDMHHGNAAVDEKNRLIVPIDLG